MKATILVLCAAILLVTAVVAPAAEPWWPEPCQDLHWWSPPSAIWRCISAVMSEMFEGWGGYEFT